MVNFLIGVDGGGTGTRALLARAGGVILGRGSAGPSALGQGIAPAWGQVQQAIRQAFADAGLDVPPWHQCALAVGLSGISNPPWRDEFVAQDPGFANLVAETDAFAMLVGAHAGKPGAIVAAGTGSVGEVLHADGRRISVSGWGFPVGDEGSGAWLGLRAMSLAQYAMDGRAEPGALARHVWAHCGRDRDSLQGWCDRAGQFAYAQLAVGVFDAAAADPAATELLRQAAQALECMALALDGRGELPLVICGSVGLRLFDRLPAALRSRCVDAVDGPAAGALTLIRQKIETR